jgi:hypothetical protein
MLIISFSWGCRASKVLGRGEAGGWRKRHEREGERKGDGEKKRTE